MNRKMQDKFCVVHYWGGQPQIRTSRFDWHHAILDESRKNGWKSVIIFSAPVQNEEINKALAESNIECIYNNRPKHQFDLRCIIDSYKLFKKVNCTVAHFHCVHTSPIIGAALAGVPVRIWSNHSSEYSDDGKSLSWIHRIGISTRLTCALAHKILPVSESIRRELFNYKVPENKMSVAPIPIDLNRYASKHKARSSVRDTLGFTEQEIIVCTVGQAIYRKGWDILIRSFAQTAEKVPQTHLLLIGAMSDKNDETSNPYHKELHRLVNELKIEDRIHFLGVRHDVADILSASDIFALPSRAEGLPLALLEAMASGLPCIATSVNGVPEVLSDSKNGLLVENEDTQAFTEGLIKLTTDDKLREQLSKNALSSLEVFSLSYQTRNIIKIYNEILSKKGLI